MRVPPPSVERLARELLVHETALPAVGGAGIPPGGRGVGAVPVEAIERVCRKLSDYLTRLLGAAGVRALMSRALALARTESQFLGAVRVGENASLEGLREAVRGREGPEVDAGLEGIVTNLLWLLVTFVGEDITLRLVTDVWPDVALAAPGLAREE